MELMYERYRGGVLIDSGYLRGYNADFDITTDIENVTNDFEIEMELPSVADDLLYIENDISTIVYVEGTEWGGEISGSKLDIANQIVTYTGRTWRGTLDQYIIEPPNGQDYLVVSGNLATSLAQIPMNPIITIMPTTYTGNTYQFNRYVTTFEGATGLLTAAQSDLRSQLVYNDGSVELSVVPARNLTELIEVSQDYGDKVSLTITRDGNTPKHLICLGSGELRDRQVIHLYADDDWNISTLAIPGAYPVETYDYSGSENLLADGRKHFLELIHNHEQIEVMIDGLDVQLSDVISAKDQLTGETVVAEITKIVWRCTDTQYSHSESFEYTTKVRM